MKSSLMKIDAHDDVVTAFEVNSLDLKRWLLNIKDRTYDNSTFPNMAPKVVMKLGIDLALRRAVYNWPMQIYMLT